MEQNRKHIIEKINGRSVLLRLRDGKATDWQSLCSSLEIDTQIGASLVNRLLSILKDLSEAGLIVVEGWNDPYTLPYPSQKIRVTPAWGLIQNALELSLTELAQVDPHESVIVEPFFGSPKKISTSSSLDLFMLMPFLPEMKPIYTDHIQVVAERLGLVIKRGDDFFTAHHVVDDIWASICNAKAVIAECTHRNPNVFYEIGMAHTVGKPVILITQNPEDVPFDLRHLRFIQYEYTPSGMKSFEVTLAKTLQGVLTGTDPRSLRQT